MIATEMEFNKIYEEYYPRILNYISKIAGPIQAEDIAQEAFVKVSRNLSSFRGESKLCTWLHRIAKNTAIDKMRSASFRHSSVQLSLENINTIEDQLAESSGKIDRIDQHVIQKEMSTCVRQFIDDLPSDYRTVIVLRELKGLTNKKIAEILNISQENAKIRLHRARTKLKESLNDGCDFYYNEENVLACDRKPSQILLQVP